MPPCRCHKPPKRSLDKPFQADRRVQTGLCFPLPCPPLRQTMKSHPVCENLSRGHLQSLGYAAFHRFPAIPGCRRPRVDFPPFLRVIQPSEYDCKHERNSLNSGDYIKVRPGCHPPFCHYRIHSDHHEITLSSCRFILPYRVDGSGCHPLAPVFIQWRYYRFGWRQ